MWALEKRKHSKEHKTAEVVWKEVSDNVTFELRLAQVEGVSHAIICVPRLRV